MDDLGHDNGITSEEGTATKTSRVEPQWKEHGNGGIIVNREFHISDNVV